MSRVEIPIANKIRLSPAQNPPQARLNLLLSAGFFPDSHLVNLADVTGNELF